MVVRGRESSSERDDQHGHRADGRAHTSRLPPERPVRPLQGRSRLLEQPCGGRHRAALRGGEHGQPVLRGTVHDHGQLPARCDLLATMDALLAGDGKGLHGGRGLPAGQRHLPALRRRQVHSGVRERCRLRHGAELRSGGPLHAACGWMHGRRKLLRAVQVGRRLPDGILLYGGLLHRTILHRLRYGLHLRRPGE